MYIRNYTYSAEDVDCKITADDNSIFPQPDKPSCQAFFISKQRRQHPALYIRNYTYSAEDVDCKLCTEHFGRNGCRQDFCPYYAERIEAGVISYGEAISSLIPPTSSIRPRLPGLIHGFPGSLWAGEKHKTRMEVFHNRLGYIKSRNTPSYYAALYLLTSNDALYRRTANCFYHGGIDFSYAVLRGISPHNYALFCAAKAALYLLTSNDALYRRTANCFYHGGIDFSYAVLRGISPHNYALFCAAKGLRNAGGVTESELADPEVIDKEAFRLIMNALLIAKYGTAAFHLKGDISHEP